MGNKIKNYIARRFLVLGLWLLRKSKVLYGSDWAWVKIGCRFNMW